MDEASCLAEMQGLNEGEYESEYESITSSMGPAVVHFKRPEAPLLTPKRRENAALTLAARMREDCERFGQMLIDGLCSIMSENELSTEGMNEFLRDSLGVDLALDLALIVEASSKDSANNTPARYTPGSRSRLALALNNWMDQTGTWVGDSQAKVSANEKSIAQHHGRFYEGEEELTLELLSHIKAENDASAEGESMTQLSKNSKVHEGRPAERRVFGQVSAKEGTFASPSKEGVCNATKEDIASFRSDVSKGDSVSLGLTYVQAAEISSSRATSEERAEAQRLQKSLESYSLQVDSLRSELEVLETECSKLRSVVHEKRSEVESLQSLQMSLESYSSKMISLRSEIATLESEDRSLSKDHSSLRAAVSERRSEVESLQSLQESLDSYSSQIASLRSEIATQGADRSLCQDRVKLSSKLGFLQHDIVEKGSEVETLRTSLRVGSEELRCKEMKVQSLKLEWQKVMDTTAQAEAKERVLKEKIASLRRELRELNNANVSKCDLIESLLIERSRLLVELAGKKGQTEALEPERKSAGPKTTSKFDEVLKNDSSSIKQPSVISTTMDSTKGLSEDVEQIAMYCGRDIQPHAWMHSQYRRQTARCSLHQNLPSASHLGLSLMYLKQLHQELLRRNDSTSILIIEIAIDQLGRAAAVMAPTLLNGKHKSDKVLHDKFLFLLQRTQELEGRTRKLWKQESRMRHKVVNVFRRRTGLLLKLRAFERWRGYCKHSMETTALKEKLHFLELRLKDGDTERKVFESDLLHVSYVFCFQPGHSRILFQIDKQLRYFKQMVQLMGDHSETKRFDR